MIRVLHVVNRMDYGGIESFIMNVYRNIDRTKIQFDFIVHDEKSGVFDEEIKALGGRIYYIIPRRKGIIANKKSLKEFFKSHKEYTIIHAHLSSLSYIEPLRYANKYGIQTRIIQSHSTNEGGSKIHKYIHKINRIFIKSIATDYWGCSDYSLEWMFGKKMVSSNICKIINNGIETSKYLYNESLRDKLRRDFNVTEKLVVGHIGRFSYPKNHEYILEVFKLINDKYKNSVLFLIGDGELRSQIENKINVLNLQDNVIMTGMRSDIFNLVQLVDVLIFPSHFEGLPITLVEAQASGMKCIVSDNITKQVKITNNIEYLSLKDKNIWAEKVLSYNNYIRNDMSVEVKKSGFDIVDVAKLLEKFYIKMNDVKS